jgi:hypothetical protein
MEEKKNRHSEPLTDRPMPDADVYVGSGEGSYLGHITEIKQNDDPEEYTVRFVVFPAKENLQAKESPEEGSSLPVIHSAAYEMVVTVSNDEFNMTPGDDLEACMDMYHDNEYDDDLSPPLRRMWKTAAIADNIAATLCSSDLFRVWDSDDCD